MSKMYDKFHRDNKDIIDKLEGSLGVLLDKFNKGIIPGGPDKLNALDLIDAYRTAMELYCKTEDLSFERVKHGESGFDEEVSVKELNGLKAGVVLLTRLAREKLIAADEAVFQSEEGKFILERGYCDEITLKESKKQYYSLSAKAEKVLKNKKLTEKIRSESLTAVVPARLIVEASKWSSLYARRVEFLRRYYTDKREGKEYLLFTLDEAKEMVFGCELGDALEVTYIFAGVFDEQIDEHIDQLKKLSTSGFIDNIVIVVDSVEMLKILEDEGIDSNLTPHISIEQL